MIKLEETEIRLLERMFKKSHKTKTKKKQVAAVLARLEREKAMVEVLKQYQPKYITKVGDKEYADVFTLAKDLDLI